MKICPQKYNNFSWLVFIFCLTKERRKRGVGGRWMRGSPIGLSNARADEYLPACDMHGFSPAWLGLRKIRKYSGW